MGIQGVAILLGCIALADLFGDANARKLYYGPDPPGPPPEPGMVWMPIPQDVDDGYEYEDDDGYEYNDAGDYVAPTPASVKDTPNPTVTKVPPPAPVPAPVPEPVPAPGPTPPPPSPTPKSSPSEKLTPEPPKDVVATTDVTVSAALAEQPTTEEVGGQSTLSASAIGGIAAAATALVVAAVLFAKKRSSSSQIDHEIYPEDMDDYDFDDVPPPPPMAANEDDIEIDERFFQIEDGLEYGDDDNLIDDHITINWNSTDGDELKST